MKEKTVKLKNYQSMVEANIDCDILKQNGIECFIGNQQFTQLYPVFNEIDTGLSITVFEDDYDKALALLDEFHSDKNLS